MSFWGVEVKPGKPYTHTHDFAKGTLRITQAALGNGKSTKRSVVQCTVGSKNPIMLCSLLPINSESHMLDLEFEEEEDVIFSVVGSRSVHLSGYFSGPSDTSGYNDGDDKDSYGEGLAELESDESDSFDSEDGFDVDFIDDDHIKTFPSLPDPNGRVVIEEIIDKEEPENVTGKQILEKKDLAIVDLDNENVISECHVHDFESEDEDGFPISLSCDKKKNSENIKEKENGDMILDVSKQVEEESIVSGSVTERESDRIENINQKIYNSEKKKKNKRKKGKIVEPVSDASLGKNAVEINRKTATDADSDLILESSKSLNKNKKRAKVGVNQNGELHAEIVEGDRDVNITEPLNKLMDDKPTLNDSVASKVFDLIKPNEKNYSVDDAITVLESNFQQLKTRSFPNGLTIGEISMGEPDGKRASNGNKVSVNYIGKLQNGTIFDSNIGKQPFQFRLGVGQVIKGWDVGVKGMRIGDKRRLTIPPSMGYGNKDVEKIPANSWLIFDVDLIDVK